MSARLSYSALRLFFSTSTCAQASSAVCRRRVLTGARVAPFSVLRTGRAFSSTRSSLAAVAPHPPGQATELVYFPTEDVLREQEEDEEDEPDIDLLPPEEAKLELTERAAEVCPITCHVRPASCNIAFTL